MANELACYIRLSHADDDLDSNQYESSSISNQRELIHNYLASHPEFDRWKIQEFVDDGYSGTSENRPEFQRMIRLARQGKIQCIIVKDFSRFARNYIIVGDYIEQIFPFLNIRFISINDSYDSAVSTSLSDNMSVVLKSILNSYYSRDLSAKMYSCNTQRMKNGDFVGTPCFGYKLNPERTHFIIDPEPARIVRHIFDLALAGHSRPEIVRILNDEGLITPGDYNRQHGFDMKNIVTTQPLWDHIKVSRILREPAYTGTLVMRKRVALAPCSKKKRATTPQEQFLRENAHEAIVSKEEFNLVQEMFPKQKGWDRKNQQKYSLKGIVRCGTCKKVMPFRPSPKPGMFQCCESMIPHSNCPSTRHLVPDVEQVVLNALLPLLQMTVKEEQRIKRREVSARLLQCQQEIQKTKREKEKLLHEKTQSYESYIAGSLSQEEYLQEKQKLSERSSSLDSHLAFLTDQEFSLQYAEIPTDLQQAAESAHKYLNATKLTRDMVVSFVDSVFLYDDHYEIVWKFKDLFHQFEQEAHLSSLPATHDYKEDKTK